MANEHIGRKQSIGLGKEGTSGTAVAATDWVPKISGAFTPKSETVSDEGAYGIIDQVKEIQTVKNWTEVQVSAIARDIYFGHFLNALFGTTYKTIKVPVSSISGTFVEGETVTETTSSATGTIRRVDPAHLYIERSTGTWTGGQTITGGTSGATATGGTIIAASAGSNHLFRRLNTNAHPSYTLYGSDVVSDDRAAYCMLDNLEFELIAGDFAKFTATFLGKKLASTTSQTPSFTTQVPFMGKHASFKLASSFSGLDAATALGVERIMLRFPKNLTDIHEFGDTSPTSFHNQDFGPVTGEITLKYNAVDQRDFVINSTKRAARLTITNSDAAAISGSEKPSLQFDMPSVGFQEFSRSTENGGIVKQTLSFTCEYDVARALTVEALLQNSRLTAY